MKNNCKRGHHHIQSIDKCKTVKLKIIEQSGPSKTISNRNLWTVLMAGACDASGWIEENNTNMYMHNWYKTKWIIKNCLIQNWTGTKFFLPLQHMWQFQKYKASKCYARQQLPIQNWLIQNCQGTWMFWCPSQVTPWSEWRLQFHRAVTFDVSRPVTGDDNVGPWQQQKELERFHSQWKTAF